MTNFLAALVLLLSVEGGLSNDADDPGGLTYAGISQVYHPEWKGWTVIISEIRKGGDAEWRLSENKKLGILVQDFYFKTIWKPMRLDDIPDDAIRLKLFGLSVHLGRYMASYALQRATGAPRDGYMGPITISSLEASLQAGKSVKILNYLSEYQKKCYTQLVKENSSKRKYYSGWLARSDAGL